MSSTYSKPPQRRSIRLKGYDYSQAGAYFLTVCTYRHTLLFGKVTNGQMALNELGTIAFDSWLSIAEKRSNLSLDNFVVMPNHVHGIIHIGETEPMDMGLVASLASTKTPGKLSSNSLGTIVGQFKGAVSKRQRRSLSRRLPVSGKETFMNTSSAMKIR